MTTRSRWRWGACVVLAIVEVSADAAPKRAEPWDVEPPLSADPAAILAAAEAVTAPADTPVVMLFEEGRFRFDADGKLRFRHRQVYRVLTAAAVDGWDLVSVGWAPWYEERPELRARVITRDGKVHELDPKTIDEGPAREASPGTYSDRRRVNAPLPAVAPGAVVELSYEIDDKLPFFAAGTVFRWYFARVGVPTERERLVIEAPDSLRVLHTIQGLGKLRPVDKRAKGTLRRVFERGPTPAWDEPEPWLATDAPREPYVGFTTGRSWSDVAATYREIVERQLAGADLGDTLKDAIGAETDPRAIVDRALAWLHENVRYTGIEFGEAAIVPGRPAETLKRRYGDCKDKSLLLAALLRRAGVQADLALLWMGPGEDVDEALPGLGYFDHAIVRVATTPPIWIDPTDEMARAGELPWYDRDRRALVISEGTKGLTRTPNATAAENLTIETRTITLAELGGARVVEVTEYHGAGERRDRWYRRDTDPVEARERLEQYVREEYGAKQLGASRHSAVEDLSRPFELTLEIDGADRIFTTNESATVELDTADTLYDLPVELRTVPGPDAKPRKHDYRAYPFRYEVRYRIQPPPGFAPAPLPPAERRTLGPATFERTFVQEGDLVVGTVRFEQPRTLLTPAEVGAMRDSIVKLLDEPPIRLLFRQIGMEQLAAGRAVEALAEFRKLAALHPKEALHHSQAAMALLAGGMGEAARAEARLGISTEHRSDEAYATLAWVLQHDLVGRQFGAGHDRAGAIAAYRKAKQLAPDAAHHRANLAILLTHDPEGELYGARADLDAAIVEIRELREKLDDHEEDSRLVYALLHRGRYVEAVAEADSLAPGAERDSLRIAALALSAGVPKALAEADRIADRAQRSEALRLAGTLVMQRREYARAAELFERAFEGGGRREGEVFLRVLRKARRHEEISTDTKTVEGVVSRFLMEASLRGVSRQRDRKALLALQAEAARELMDEAAWEAMELVWRTARRRFLRVGFSFDAGIDLALGILEVRVDGDAETGWRVRFDAGGLPVAARTAFVVTENGSPKVLAMGNDLRAVGREAFRLAEAKKLEGARRWLDRAREELASVPADDPPAGEPFAALWVKGSQAERQEILVAAAALMVEGPHNDKAIVTLEACVEAGGSGATHCRSSLVRAYLHAKRSKEALATTQALAKEHPDSRGVALLRFVVYTQLGRSDDLDALSRGLLERDPASRLGFRAAWMAALIRNDLPAVRKVLEEMIAKGVAEVADHNQLAWISLFDGGVDAAALEHARKAVSSSRGECGPCLHTLASLLAHTGDTVEAYRALLESVEMNHHIDLIPSDWLVIGLIAEAYGLDEIALAAYARVAREESPRVYESVSSRLLAQRRAAALKQRAKPATHPR